MKKFLYNPTCHSCPWAQELDRRVSALEAERDKQKAKNNQSKGPSTPAKRGCPVYPYLSMEMDGTDINERIKAFVLRSMEGQQLKTRIKVGGYSVALTRYLVCLHNWLIYNGKTTVEDNNVAAYRRFLIDLCPEIVFPAMQSFNREAKFLNLPKEISKMLPADLGNSEMTVKELEIIQIVYHEMHIFFAEK